MVRREALLFANNDGSGRVQIFTGSDSVVE
jgi:hypothetical protein